MVPAAAFVVHLNNGVRLPDTVAEKVKVTVEPAETNGVLPVMETIK